MTQDVFALLLDNRMSELTGKDLTSQDLTGKNLNGNAVESRLNQAERAELRVLAVHQDKAPAVVHRIRVLAAKLAQSNRWGMLVLRFSKKFRQNLAELEALIQYGNSKAVWEIAYLTRKKALSPLLALEAKELHYLRLYYDSPDVLRITRLKLKVESGERLSVDEAKELDALQRNPYRTGVPGHLLEMLWPADRQLPANSLQTLFQIFPAQAPITAAQSLSAPSGT